MANQGVEPWGMRIGVGTPFDVGVGDGRTEFRLKPLQTGEAGSDFLSRESRNGKEEAVVAVGVDLLSGERLHFASFPHSWPERAGRDRDIGLVAPGGGFPPWRN